MGNMPRRKEGELVKTSKFHELEFHIMPDRSNSLIFYDTKIDLTNTIEFLNTVQITQLITVRLPRTLLISAKTTMVLAQTARTSLRRDLATALISQQPTQIISILGLIIQA